MKRLLLALVLALPALGAKADAPAPTDTPSPAPSPAASATRPGVAAKGEKKSQSSPEETPGANTTAPGSLSDLPIEDLVKLKVTTANRTPESLSRVPAAIYVITQEDIRRSAATSIPDLLRMVPGVHVAQIDADKWAVTVRGLNARFAGYVLVLLDGRAVYTPFSGGVNWDAQDTVLEDIDRIEVVRGPGGAVWGANAVNGVINIITKHAKDTQGTLLVGGGGNLENGFGTVRYGGKIDADTYYRVFAKYFDRNDLEGAVGGRYGSGWEALRGGFRIDREQPGRDHLMVQTDFLSEHLPQRNLVGFLTPPYFRLSTTQFPGTTGDVLARYDHPGARGALSTYQFFYTHSDYNSPDLAEVRDVYDFDYQNRLAPIGPHHLIFGIDYRKSPDETRQSTVGAYFTPANRTLDLFSLRLHDDIDLSDAVRLTAGMRLEHSNFAGLQLSPNVRAAWTPDPRRTAWAAVSRAVRTPARTDLNANVFRVVAPPDPNGSPVPVAVQIIPRQVDSEKLLAYELGYRVQPTRRLFVDLATFYNFYSDLLVREAGSPVLVTSPVPHLVIPLTSRNDGRLETYGYELTARWNASPNWSLHAGYSLLQHRNGVTSSPENQFNFGSYLNLPHNFTFNTQLYVVGSLDQVNGFGQTVGVPGYVRLDALLSWRPKGRHYELGLGALNLLNSRHIEFQTSGFEVPALSERSVYGKATLRF